MFETLVLVELRTSDYENIRHANKELLKKAKVTSLCASLCTEEKGVANKSLFSLLDLK